MRACVCVCVCEVDECKFGIWEGQLYRGIEAYNSALKKFTQLWDPAHSPVLESIFITSCLLAVHPCCHLSRITQAFPSVTTALLFLEISCKWNHAVGGHSEISSQNLMRKPESQDSRHTFTKGFPRPACCVSEPQSARLLERLQTGSPPQG